MPYHCQLNIRPKLPLPWGSDGVWVKGDMIYSVGFHRLNLVRLDKDRCGKRIYRMQTLLAEQMKVIESCVLRGSGLAALSKHL